MMVYLKSAAVGLCTLIAFIVISPFIILPILTYQYRRQFPNRPGEIGWDPASLLKHSPLAWFLLFIAFAIGFGWKYRQITR
jgi:hypothetical protein